MVEQAGPDFTNLERATLSSATCCLPCPLKEVGTHCIRRVGQHFQQGLPFPSTDTDVVQPPLVYGVYYGRVGLETVVQYVGTKANSESKVFGKLW